MRHTHTYRSTVAWSGSTAVGYEAYDRSHTLRTPGVDGETALSGDQAFGGDPTRLNPEVLLVAAASSCQLLSFLAVAARARLDVVTYQDDAVAVMPEGDAPMRITRIELRPVIELAETAAGRVPDARLTHLCEVAHRECFIANSLVSDIVCTPTFRWVDATPAGPGRVPPGADADP